MADQSQDILINIKALIEGGASVDELAAELDKLGVSTDEAGSEASKLSADLAKLNRQAAAIDSFRTVEADAVAASQGLQELQTKTAAVEATQASYTASLEASSGALSVARATVADLAAEQGRANVNYKLAQDATAALSAESKAATATAREYGQALKAAASDVTATERSLASTETQITRNDAALQKLSVRLEAARTAQRDLSNQVIAAEEPTDALIARQEKATASLVSLQTQLEAAKDRGAALRLELGDQRAALATVDEAYKQQAAVTQAASQAAADYKAQLTGARAAQAESKTALQGLNAELKVAQKAEADLAKIVDADQASIEKQNAVLQQLADQTKVASAAVDEQVAALTAAEATLQRVGVSADNLTAEQQRVTSATINARTAVGELVQSLGDEATALGVIGPKADEVASAFSRLNVRPFSAIKADIVEVEAALDTLKTSGTLSIEELEVAEASAAAQTARLRAEMDATAASGKHVEGSFAGIHNQLAELIGIYLGFEGARKIAELADAAKQADSQLKLVTTSTEEFTSAQQQLFEIAQQTRTSYADTVNLFARLDRSTKSLGLSQAQLFAVTETVNKSIQIGGSNAEEASRAIVQFSQGLAAGTLHGQDLNSVLEQAPGLAKVLADGLGITVGQLRQFAQQGKLTADELVNAILREKDTVDKTYPTIAVTISNALTQVENALLKSVGNIDAATGASTNFSEAIQASAKYIQPTFEFLAGDIELLIAGVRQAFDVLAGTFDGIAAIVAESSGLIVRALSEITFGDLSKGFAQAADVLENRAAELGKKVKANLKDIGDATIQASDGIGRATAGVVDFYKAATTATPPTKALATAQGAAADSSKKLGDNVKQAGLSVGQYLKDIGKDADTARNALNRLNGKELVNLGDELATSLDKAQASLKALEGTATGDAGKVSDAIGKSKANVDALGIAIDQVRTEQFKRLGVDTTLVLNGLTQKTQQNIDIFKKLGASASGNVKLITAAFEGLLAQVSTRAGLDALRSSLEGVKTSGFDVAGAIQQIDAKFQTLAPDATVASQQVADAFRTLGIQSSAAMALSAKSAQDAFAKISNSGTASAQDVTNAFLAMAKAELDAAAAAGTTAVQVKAAELEIQAGTQQQIDGLTQLTNKYPELGKSAADAGQSAAQGIKPANTAIDDFKTALQKAPDLQHVKDAQTALTTAYADGKFGAQEYQAAIAAAQQKQDDLASAATGVGAALANQLTYLRNKFVDMGTAATAEFDAIVKKSVVVGESVGTFIDDFNRRLGALNKLVEQQSQQAKQLIADLNNTNYQTALTVQQAQSAAASFKYLDSQTLGDLNNAISAVKSNIDSLDQSVSQTLNDLQNQLDQLNGNTLAVEQRANAAKKAALEDQLKQAQFFQDSASIQKIQQSLALLDQIGSVEAKQAAQQSTTSPSLASQSMGSYDLNLTINGQSLGTVQASSQQQAEAIIQALQAAQSTSVVQ